MVDQQQLDQTEPDEDAELEAIRRRFDPPRKQLPVDVKPLYCGSVVGISKDGRFWRIK
jgi:hypothetical protein